LTAERPWSNYNIHDAIRLRTNIEFTTIPAYFRVGSVNPNFEIEFVPRLDAPPVERVNREAGYTVYEIGNGELVYETDIPIMYLLGSRERWRFHVTGLADEQTKVVTSLPYFDFAPVQFKVTELISRLVHLILVIKLLANGYAFCHATTVAKEGNANLLFGYSGTGKSLLANDMVRAGYGYMSEDFTIVSGSGTVLCYPDMPPPRSRVSKLPISRYLRGKRLDRKLEGTIQDRARIQSIVLLEKGPERVEELDPEEASRRIMLLNFEEISKLWNSPISIILNHYAYFYRKPDLQRVLAEYQLLVSMAVRRAERCIGVRSRSPNLQTIRRLVPGA
jgi:hypothetical protein